MKRYVSYNFGERFDGYEAMNADAKYLGGQLDSALEMTLEKMTEAFNRVVLFYTRPNPTNDRVAFYVYGVPTRTRTSSYALGGC